MTAGRSGAVATLDGAGPGPSRIDRLARWLSALAEGRLAAPALLLLALLAFAPGFLSMPPMDRDEPRFAQASKQMLETGDFVNIRFQDEARLKKPAGIYWLQAAAVATGEALGLPEARTTIALYRAPSLIAAIGAVLMTWWTGLALGSRRAAFLAGAIMATSILLGVEARLAKTDATLLLTVLVMLGVLARFLPSPDPHGGDRAAKSLAVLFWFAAAASVLVKGPVGPLVVGFAMIGTSLIIRQWRWLGALRWPLGLAILVIAVSPWFIAIMVKTGGDFLQKSVGDDMLNKVAGGQESHGAPPGLYLAAVWATFWPWAPLAALAAPFAWASRRAPRIAFILAWLVPSWLLFEAVPTKLPHYVLPLYPALALLIAIAIDEGRMARGAWARALPALSPLLAAAAAVATLIAVWQIEHRAAVLLGLALTAAVVASVVAWRLQARGRFIEAMPAAVAASLVLAWGVYGLGLKTLPSLWPSPKLAAFARSMDCPDPAFLSAGFNEPSLVFLVGTGLELETGARAADFLAGGPCRMAFVEGRMAKDFAGRAAELGLAPAPVGRVEGININGGKRLDIAVYRSAGSVSP